MATYVNDLRLKEIGTGESSGTWGTETNTNLELIAEAFSYGTEASFGSDADATTTIADGSTDPARSLYLKVTSGASLTATRTLTIAPNTVSKVWIIENATSGSQSINISQGSGANVTIPNGDVKVVYSDGAGSGAAIVDAFTDLNLGGTTTISALSVSSTTTFSDDVTFTGASNNLVWDKSDDSLEFADNAKAKFGASDDLQIYHDGSNSRIQEAGTGSLLVRGSNLQLQDSDGYDYLTCTDGGNGGTVALKHLGSTVLSTAVGGITVTSAINDMTIAASGITGPSGQNFAINTPNSLRINIDSDNNGTSEVFVVGHNRTDVGSTDALFKVTEAGTSTFFSTATTDTVVLQSTDAGASAAPDLVLFRDSSSPADGDDIGNILFRGKDDGGNETSYAFIMGEINDASNGSEDGNLFFRTQSGGSLDNRISIVSNLVGIGQDAPNSPLEVLKDITFSSADTFPQIVIRTDSGSTGDQLGFGVDKADSLAFIQATERGTNVIPLVLQRYGGRVAIGNDSPNTILDVQASASNLFSTTGVVSGGTEAFKMRQSRGSLSSPSNSSANGDGNYLISQIYRDSDYNTCANIGMVTGASTDDGEIRFSTALSGTVSEAMRIDENGSVGIGTTSPGGSTSCLHVVHDATEGTPSFPDGEVIIAQRNFNSSQGCHIGIIAGTASESAVNFGDKDDSDIGYISYNHSTNAMHLGTSASNRLNIHSDGHVGIGMTAAAVSSDTVLSIYNSTTPRIKLHNSSTGTSGTDGGELNMTGTDFIIENRESGNLRLFTNGSEAMRIESNQDILIGTTSAIRGSEKVGIAGGSADCMVCQTHAAAAVIRKQSFVNGFIFLFERDDNGFALGSITTDGTNTAFNTSSDGRLKDVTGEARGLEVINELNPVSYNWKANGKADEGLIAQEVKEIVPNAVSGSEEEMYQMDYSKLVVHLVKAVKEQQTQIEALQSEINLLKGE